MIDDWGPLSEAQIDLISRAGFAHFSRIVWLSTDAALVYAVAEHFWPSTSTFHFSFGEMSITLEDTAFLTGLRICGRPVTGVHVQDYTPIIQQFLGRDPPDASARAGKLHLTWLRSEFGAGRLPAVPTDFEVKLCINIFLMYNNYLYF